MTLDVSNKDWVQFVAEVRSRLDVLDNKIENMNTMNDTQHRQLRADFNDLKERLIGDGEHSLLSKVRSLEDTRTKMNGIQLGVTMVISAVVSVVSWFCVWLLKK